MIFCRFWMSFCDFNALRKSDSSSALSALWKSSGYSCVFTSAFQESLCQLVSNSEKIIQNQRDKHGLKNLLTVQPAPCWHMGFGLVEELCRLPLSLLGNLPISTMRCAASFGNIAIWQNLWGQHKETSKDRQVQRFKLATTCSKQEDVEGWRSDNISSANFGRQFVFLHIAVKTGRRDRHSAKILLCSSGIRPRFEQNAFCLQLIIWPKKNFPRDNRISCPPTFLFPVTVSFYSIWQISNGRCNECIPCRCLFGIHVAAPQPHCRRWLLYELSAQGDDDGSLRQRHGT